MHGTGSRYTHNTFIHRMSHFHKALFTLGANDYKHWHKNDVQHVARYFSFIVTATMTIVMS